MGLLCALSTSVQAAPIYHWLDEQGHPVFSDLPKGVSRNAATIDALSQPVRAASGALRVYRHVRIKSYQTDHYHQRIIQVHTSPALHPSDQIALYLNQKRYQSALHSLSFLLHGLPDGRHKLNAVIQDAQGRVLSTSDTIHLQVQP